MKTMVRPAFDPRKMVWFIEFEEMKRPIEAPTLRELEEKLGHSYQIADYYPHGHGTRVKYREPRDREPTRMTQGRLRRLQNEANAKAVAPQPSKPRPRKYDHEAILNMWAAGTSAPEIAWQLKIPKWKRVSSLIHNYQLKGDPRAAKRGHH